MPPPKRPVGRDAWDPRLITVGLELEMLVGIGNPALRGVPINDSDRISEIVGRWMRPLAEEGLIPPYIVPFIDFVSSLANNPRYDKWIIEYEVTNEEDFPQFRDQIEMHERSRLPRPDYANNQHWLHSRDEDSDMAELERGVVELVSRIFTREEWENRAYTRELSQFLRAIETFFYTYTPDDNRSCTVGLHVHVGVGRGRTFDLQALKNLMTMLTIYEVALDGMHPVHRTDDKGPFGGSLAGPADNNPTIRRCTKDHSEDIVWPGGPQDMDRKPFSEMTDEETFDLIMAQESISEVWYATHPGSKREAGNRPKYNFRLDRGTVEFRQHRATKDSEEIEMWMTFVTRTVEVAYRYATTDGENTANLRSDLLGGERDLVYFLHKFLNLPDDVVRYYTCKQAGYQPEKDAWFATYLDDYGNPLVPWTPPTFQRRTS